MPLNTPVPQRIVGGTTAQINATSGSPKQLIADLDKKTLVLMDGVTPGGHPLATAATKIKAGTPNVKINNGTEAPLGSDITITLIPGTVPGNITLVENPAGQPAGTYLQFEYTTNTGAPDSYFVNVTALVDVYTAGKHITITDGEIAVNRKTLAAVLVAPGGGLQADANGQLSVNINDVFDASGSDSIIQPGPDGKLTIDLEKIVDTGPGSLLQIVDGKITLKSVVSADADNIIKAGTDNLAFMAGDLGNLSS